MTIFSDFTDGGNPAATDYVAGYATGGGGGSDRRWQMGALFAAQTVLNLAGAGNCSFEIGRTDGVASTPLIDFHSGATAVDFDVRLIASAGTGVSGGASLQFFGAGGFWTANDTAPLGIAGNAWSDLFLAAGGIINWNNGATKLVENAGGLFYQYATASAGLHLQQSDAGANGPVIFLEHLSASPAVSDQVAQILFLGQNSAAAQKTYGAIVCTITDPNSTTEDAGIDIYNIRAGTSAVRLRIDAANITGINTTGFRTDSPALAAGIGFATGAGNAQTQATSKSTTVTCNGMCGDITTNAASLAANTVVSFLVNNSSFAAADTVLASYYNGTALAYQVNTRATGAGQFAVDLLNRTAGALAESVVIRFVIIKTVQS